MHAPWRLAAIAAALAMPALADPDAVALERLVLQDCGSCHGMTLRGGLGPAITPQAMAKYDNDILAGIILDGVPGTPMPPWRPLLAADEVKWIVTYLKEGPVK